jgi:hypothetical protein
MPILNQHDSYYLSPDREPVNRPATDRAGFMLNGCYDFSDKDYWHVSCFNGKSLLQLKDVVPNHILQEIRDRKITLSIGAEYEGFIDIPEIIYDFLIKELSIPAESIILFSPNFRIANLVDRLSSERNLPEIQTRWVCVFERGVSSSPTNMLDTLQLKEYPKKFLSLNRRWRGCKVALVSHLKIRNLLDNGFVSLQSFEKNSWENFWEHMMQFQDPATKQLFDQHKHEIVNLPDLTLDDTNLENMTPVTNALDHYYLNSYFSVVGGAAYYKKDFLDGTGIDEKPFKAIQKKHPFILLSTANSLPLLHTMGYKTFDGLIDESYDNETDDDKRMIMVVNEIERLCNLNDAELETFLIEAKKIVEHNFKNMYYRACLPRV